MADRVELLNAATGFGAIRLSVLISASPWVRWSLNAAVAIRGFRDESASSTEIFRRAQDPLCSGAVRGYPWRREGQGRAGRTSGDGPHRRSGLRRLRPLGL